MLSVLDHVIYKTKETGPFLLVVEIRAVNASQAKAENAAGSFEVEFVSPTGYLSALDYPLLSFTAILGVVYIAFW